MVAGAAPDDHGAMDIILLISLVAVVSLVGAGVAGGRAMEAETGVGRLAAYWLWRFPVEFTW